MHLLTKVYEIRGALITYLGGSGISAYGFTAKAADSVSAAKAVAHQAVTEAVSQVPQIAPDASFNKFIAIGGLIFVGGRLAFDIFKYFDQRRISAYEQYLKRKAMAEDE